MPVLKGNEETEKKEIPKKAVEVLEKIDSELKKTDIKTFYKKADKETKKLILNAVELVLNEKDAWIRGGCWNLIFYCSVFYNSKGERQGVKKALNEFKDAIKALKDISKEKLLTRTYVTMVLNNAVKSYSTGVFKTLGNETNEIIKSMQGEELKKQSLFLLSSLAGKSDKTAKDIKNLGKVLELVYKDGYGEQEKKQAVKALEVLIEKEDFGEILKLIPEVSKKQEYLPMEKKINLAYGTYTLGEKNMLELLFKKKIHFFLRYTKEELERQLYQIDKDYKPKYVTLKELKEQEKKPVFLVVYNQNDYNGAFYKDDTKFNFLSKYFNVVVYEVGAESQFYYSVKETGKKYGEITHLLIGGHGTPEHILLGYPYEEQKIDLTDIEEMKKIKGYTKDSVLILESCSTGAEGGIGEKLKDALGVKNLFAPKTPAFIKQGGYKINYKNKKPVITEVEFVETKQ
ncbi:hypothetical protein JXB01_04470 [Candidatus Micrarchaeota archaeon]|nr:hypothetical protein [Candidatus Micrarchaeota archaeon]